MKKEISLDGLLWAFVAFVVVLVAIRFIISKELHFVFLPWNIFLAWIPFYISKYFKGLAFSSFQKKYFVLGIWLLFFPNALYIVTDLIHLEIETPVPKWYDTVMIFSAAIVGLIMAFVSLLRVEQFLIKIVSAKKTTWIVLAILFISSFGVYLGRFLRWNSWDIVCHPFRLTTQISDRIIFPFEHLYTWGVTVLFTVLFFLL